MEFFFCHYIFLCMCLFTRTLPANLPKGIRDFILFALTGSLPQNSFPIGVNVTVGLTLLVRI